MASNPTPCSLACRRRRDQDPPADIQAARARRRRGRAAGHAPDAIVLAGDRFETAAAALAATLERVPIVHLHGGEQTLGAFDDALRHAITKLSHLHLVSHQEHARRVLAMGEDPLRPRRRGARAGCRGPRRTCPTRDGRRRLGIALDPPVVVVTVHPATLDADPAGRRAGRGRGDGRGRRHLRRHPAEHGPGRRRGPRAARGGGRRQTERVAVDALGERRYWGLLRIADAMLGNSSSALIEAPAVGLPAVNVGGRQAGRRAGPTCSMHRGPRRVAEALRDALDPATRSRAPRARPRSRTVGPARDRGYHRRMAATQPAAQAADPVPG